MKDKISRYAIISVGILSSVVLLVIFAEYILPVISPFLIAGLVAMLTVSPAKRLAERLKAPPKVVRLVISVLVTLLFFSLASFIVWRVSTSAWHFLVDFSRDNRLYDMLSALFSKEIPIFGEIFPPELAGKISDAVGELISSSLTGLGEGITSIVAGVPRLLFFLLVTLISLVYFSLDYDRIVAFASSVLPDKVISMLRKAKISLITVMKKYVLSYLLILLITYFTVLVGLWLLRVDHAAVISLLVALVDLMPVIGVGTVLIPWGIFALATGNKFLGIGLILLFVVNTVVRQLTEPRIVGKSLNLHPLITLMTIYIGYALFGFIGLFILPVIAVSISAMLNSNNAAEIG